MNLHINPNEGERSRMLHHLNALAMLLQPYQQPDAFSDWQKRYLEHMDGLGHLHVEIIRRSNRKAGEHDEVIEAQLVAEETCEKPSQFVLSLDVKSLALTVSAMQLALRHPDFKTTGAAARVQGLVNQYISLVPDTLPHYRSMLMKGNEHPQGPK